LRKNAGDVTGHLLGQKIWTRLAIEKQRLADDVEILVCAYTSELRGAITLWVFTKRFEVVPIDTFACHFYFLQRLLAPFSRRSIGIYSPLQACVQL
jgi:hypothetical protein